MAEKVSQEMAVSSKYKNPFIGLRPFTREEQHLYFGREEHAELALQKLLKKKFIAITGASGMGKTSFANCGLIPGIVNHGKWEVIETIPGKQALDDLYRQIQKITGSIADEAVPKDIDSKKSGIISNLRAFHKKKGISLILFIDQFEQLFISDSPAAREKNQEKVVAYLDTLLALLRSGDVPLLLIINLRSDYIGECSAFNDFTDLLNNSSYMLPKMNREELRKAIEGPLKVTGSDWDQRLVERIINDLIDKPDQLPVLQHVLMRSFEAWKDPDLARKPFSVFAYENSGGAANAISLHAEEAYQELDDSLKRVCERVFKVIALKTNDNREITKSFKISEIASIGQMETEKILKVVNVFNRSDIAFISPVQGPELNTDSVIRLSHEALIRNWKRLQEWVNEEAESVQMYLKLAEAAAKFQLGKTNLWVPPQLDLALEWKQKNNPGLAWARRYNPAYERTMVFLDLSENEYLQDQENKTRNDRIRLKRSRIISIASSIAAVILLFVYLNTDRSGNQGSANYIPVEAETTVAQNIPEESSIQEAGQDMQSGMNGQTTLPEGNSGLVENRLNQQNQGRTRQSDVNEAIVSPVTNSRQQTTANPFTDRTTRQSAQESGQISRPTVEEPARTSTTPAEQSTTRQDVPAESTPNFSKEKMLGISASLAERSAGVSQDPDLKALLAYQAYQFNNEYNSNAFNAAIYTALYQSMKVHLGDAYNVYSGHSNAIRTIDFLPGSSTFFSAGSDGKILKWNPDNERREAVTILSGRGIIEKIRVTGNGNYLLIGENRGGMQLLDLRTPGKSPETFKGADANIRSIALARDNNTFYTAGLENFIERHSINGRSSEKVIQTGSRVNSIAISPSGDELAGGTRDGKIIIWKTTADYEEKIIYTDADNAVQSVSYSPNGRYLACGGLNGNILIFRTSNYELVRVLSGHTARVTEIDFSPNSAFIASSAYDGKVLLWNMGNLSGAPVRFDDNGGFVFSVRFSNDGRYLASGSAQENRLLARPVSASQLADRICFVVSRNLTQAEWSRYVASDVPYQKTCSDK